MYQDFNPLPRKEGDCFSDDTQASKKISIHSLVKRETAYSPVLQQAYVDFNPLPRKEGDRKYS